MRFIALLLLLSGSAFQYLMAQYAIGHTTLTFNDPARTGGYGSGGGPGRQIQTEVYYPAVTSGDNVALAPSAFPLIVFGHGFAMSWDAYQNVWEAYVPAGYVVAFPRTEGGLIPGPSHGDFALDLKLVETKMQALNASVTSLFYQHLVPNSAIAGHSMGGGATILAGDNTSTTLKTIIGMAPAETTPSAISGAPNVSVPALIFSGSSDGVTPPIDHHQPIYDALGSDCKTFVSITGGAHCYFANSNFNCDFGETTSSTGITVTRDEQQQITYRLLLPWLDFYLYENCDAFNAFNDSLTSVSGITNQQTCSYTPLTVSDVLTHINLGGDGAIDLTVTGGSGTISFNWSNSATTEDLTNLSEGTYTVEVSDDYCTFEGSYLILGPAGLDQSEFQWVLYPNPAKEVLTISGFPETADDYCIQVQDVLGRTLKLDWIDSGVSAYQLVVSDLAPGNYQLVLSAKNGWSEVIRFSIQ